jgi:hypothetical protein
LDFYYVLVLFSVSIRCSLMQAQLRLFLTSVIDSGPWRKAKNLPYVAAVSV